MSESLERLLRRQLFGIYLLNIADYFLTVAALAEGHGEANPIMAPLVGTIMLPIIKFFLVPLILLLIWKTRHRIGQSLISVTWVPVISYCALMLYYWTFIFR